MRVFVTGASGFVGSAVLAELAGRGNEVVALVHREGVDAADANVRIVQGSVFDAEVLHRGINGADAVIHLVGIIQERPSKGVTFQRMHVEATRCVVDATVAAKVKRYVHMSALGAREHSPSAYHLTKHAAEQIVRRSPLAWTIFRPSMIHGPRGEFMELMNGWARKKRMPYLFMPYFGKGALGFGRQGKLQPVYVGDVARAFVEALQNAATIEQVFEIGGPQQFTWTELHRAVAQEIVGHRRWTWPIPAWYALLLTKVAPGSWLPFNAAQVHMALEDNVCDLAPFEREFCWRPRELLATLREYRAQLR